MKYILSVTLYGLNGIVASQIALSSYEIVFFRALLGSVLLVAIFLISGGRFRIRENRRDYLIILIAGVIMGTGWLFLYEAFSQIGVGMATLLNYCGPVLMMIFAPLIFKEKLTAPKVIGFLIVVFGVFLINGKASVNGGNAWGMICGFLSAVAFFVMVALNKQSKNVVGIENAAIQLVGAFLVVAVFVGIRQRFVIHVQPEDWVWIIILGGLNTGVAGYLYFSPLSKLPVQTVAVFGYMEPLLAVVFSALLLKESMTPLQIVGAACIIGGAMVGELIKGSHKAVAK